MQSVKEIQVKTPSVATLRPDPLADQLPEEA